MDVMQIPYSLQKGLYLVVVRKKERGRMSQRQQREIKEDIKQGQTEKNPAALQCWSNQLFDLAPLLFQCGPNNAVLIVLLATSELPYVAY